MNKYAERMAESFESELRKIAAARIGGAAAKVVPSMVAGAVGWEALRRANNDRRIGRQMRIQGNGQ